LSLSWKIRYYPGEFSMIQTDTLIYRMAFAIHCEKKGVDWSEAGGFLPWWVGDLRLAEVYSPESVGVDFSKWIWYRRAITYAEAQNRATDFEEKK
jgi:hypothetical protein